jgi:hypothetical protein
MLRKGRFYGLKLHCKPLLLLSVVRAVWQGFDGESPNGIGRVKLRAAEWNSTAEVESRRMEFAG